VKLQYNDGGTWVDISLNGAMGLIISDGANVRALNTHSSNAENITLFPLQ
jgi:exopolysaccharide biosynthesis protein